MTNIFHLVVTTYPLFSSFNELRDYFTAMADISITGKSGDTSLSVKASGWKSGKVLGHCLHCYG